MDREHKYKPLRFLRNEIRQEALSIAQRARFLAWIDPDFAEEIEEMRMTPMVELAGPIGLPPFNVEVLRRSPGDWKPFDAFHYQFREDFCSFFEKVAIVGMIDPEFEKELQSFGLLQPVWVISNWVKSDSRDYDNAE